MSGPLRVERLTCYQGITFSETRLFFTRPASGSTDVQDLAPMDFTGCTARMTVRAAADPSLPTLLSIITGTGDPLLFVADTFTPGPPTPAFNNGIKITILAAASLAMNGGMPVRDAYYDLIVDQPGSTSLLLMAGPFDLLPTVTR